MGQNKKNVCYIAENKTELNPCSIISVIYSGSSLVIPPYQQLDFSRLK